jgi:hypothetical protein
MIWADPNPCDKVLVIKFKVLNKNSLIKMSLNDIFGREIAICEPKKYDTGEFKEQIPVTDLADGMYILPYLNNNKIISSVKIIVAH